MLGASRTQVLVCFQKTFEIIRNTCNAPTGAGLKHYQTFSCFTTCFLQTHLLPFIKFNYVFPVGYVNCLLRAYGLMKVGMTLRTRSENSKDRKSNKRNAYWSYTALLGNVETEAEEYWTRMKKQMEYIPCLDAISHRWSATWPPPDALSMLEDYILPATVSCITPRLFNSTQNITQNFLLCNFCILFPYLPSQILILSTPLHFPLLSLVDKSIMILD